MFARQKFALSAGLVLLLGGALLVRDHAVKADHDEGPQYEYREDVTRVVGMLRLGQVVYGRLDAVGNFLEDPPLRPDEQVYEYRSGSLIKGTLREDGRFVPEKGSVIIPFKDYQYGKDALRIYNLPGTFVEK